MVLKRRHLAKAITWRIGGTIVTIIIAAVIAKDLSTGLIIGPLDFIGKIILYYVHERLWLRSKFGVRSNGNGG